MSTSHPSQNARNAWNFKQEKKIKSCEQLKKHDKYLSFFTAISEEK